MKMVVRMITGLALVLVLGGCVTGQQRGWVTASVRGANYTEDYIYDVSIQTTDGKRVGLGIARVNEFSRGGTSGSECCAFIPAVGQTIKVVWQVGGRQQDKSQWRTYSRDVVVTGAMPKKKDAYNILIVRFFQEHQLEAELIPDRGEAGGTASPRVDKLYSGQRAMRQKGE
ncbi:Protein of unknown function [Cupriavidus sp. YR651]|uniref:DUF3304 domain-containing protein n=1 Tax=Cupriavidus sp. YR651 TaxID=1855315 RepID=UPI00088EAEF1|nr:DUF3304 domain-containing protein [Cupriavidus sp. YR651]SDB98910.1 Protein of unknown function [Cupriavidus sp. YR651]